MALQLRGRRSVLTTKFAATGLLIAALVLQPLYGWIAPDIADAAIMKTVNQNSVDWVDLDTRPGGATSFTSELGAPTGFGASALKITTTDGNAKAQKFTSVSSVPLSGINDISYWAYRSAESTGSAVQVAALNLVLDFNGPDVGGGFTTLVLEPVYQPSQGALLSNTWQKWNGGNSDIWWSSNPIPSAPNRDTFVSLQTIKDNNPQAVVNGIGFNQGSGNAGIISAVDGLTFNGDTYNFEEKQSLAQRINAASAGDVIDITENEAVNGTIVVSKPLTIKSSNGSTITTSGSGNLFRTTANGVTFEGIKFVKTDKTGQHIISIGGDNTTIKNNSFTGQYVLGDNDVARALEVSTASGLNITGNTVTGFRQPAYINGGTTGAISNNSINGTRGWVLHANTNLTFTGNTFSGNAEDIAILAPMPADAPNNYSCATIYQIKAANNNAYVRNQTPGFVCAPTVPTGGQPHEKTLGTNDFYFTWDASADDKNQAVSYEFRSSMDQSNVGSAPDDSAAWKSGVLSSPTLHSVGAPDGTWYWQVRSIDVDGNKSEWSSVWNVTLDQVAPAAPVLSVKAADGTNLVSGAYTNKYSIVAQWTAPSGSPVKYIYKYWNAIPGNPYTASNPYNVETTGTSQPGVFNQGEGTHYMQIFAVDAAGNTSPGSNVFEVKYDANGPVVAFTSPAANQLFGGRDSHPSQKKTITVGATASDAAGIGAYCVKLDGGSCVSGGYFFQPSNGTLPNVAIDTTNLTSGTHMITLRVTDRAGNATELSRSVIVDNTKPVITTNIADGQVLSGNATLTLSTAGETNPSITNIRVLDANGQVVQVNGAAQGAYDVDGLTTLSYSLDTTKLVNGAYRIQFSARDALGNAATTLFRNITITNQSTDDSGSGSTTGNANNSGNTNSGTSNNQTGGQVAGTSTNSAATTGAASNSQNARGTSAQSTNDQNQDAFTTYLASSDANQAESTSTAGILGTDTSDSNQKDNSKSNSSPTGYVADASASQPNGFAWYWWLIIAGAVAAIWWMIAAVRRRKNSDI